jgi:hypothetical protein
VLLCCVDRRSRPVVRGVVWKEEGSHMHPEGEHPRGQWFTNYEVADSVTAWGGLNCGEARSQTQDLSKGFPSTLTLESLESFQTDTPSRVPDASSDWCGIVVCIRNSSKMMC